MAVDEHGIETIRRAGELVDPPNRADMYIKVGGLPSTSPGNIPPVGTWPIPPGPSIYYKKTDGQTNPGSAVQLISETDAQARELLSCDIVCRHEGKGVLKIGATVFASFRTSAGHPRDKMNFYPPLVVPAGQTVLVEFTGRLGSPIVDVEAYVQGFQVT